MADDTAAHMARFWDARAKEDARYFVDNRLAYKNADDATFWAAGEADLDRLLDQAGVTVAPSDVVLDVGCGVGRLMRPLATRAAHVHGIDVSEEMLDRARANLADRPDVTLHLGDGTGLAPVADASVDAVVSLVVFQHIPDPAITLGYVREIGRVLRPGGWAAFQISNDPAIHTHEWPAPSRVKVLLGRAPKGQADPAWRGSAVALADVRAAADDGGLDVEHVHGETTQYCIVRARRRAFSG